MKAFVSLFFMLNVSIGLLLRESVCVFDFPLLQEKELTFFTKVKM